MDTVSVQTSLVVYCCNAHLACVCLDVKFLPVFCVWFVHTHTRTRTHHTHTHATHTHTHYLWDSGVGAGATRVWMTLFQYASAALCHTYFISYLLFSCKHTKYYIFFSILNRRPHVELKVPFTYPHILFFSANFFFATNTRLN
jgi:hypothetical protein